MISGKSLLSRTALQHRQTNRMSGFGRIQSTLVGMSPRQGGVIPGKRLLSLVRMTDSKVNHGHSMRGTRIPFQRCSRRNNPRRYRKTEKRMSTNDATSEVGATTEPTSEETAQQLSQLLEQPLALESFITKELTSNQRQAIQRLVHASDVVDVDVPEPSEHSLRLVAMNTAIPFVGFGYVHLSHIPCLFFAFVS